MRGAHEKGVYARTCVTSVVSAFSGPTSLAHPDSLLSGTCSVCRIRPHAFWKRPTNAVHTGESGESAGGGGGGGVQKRYDKAGLNATKKCRNVEGDMTTRKTGGPPLQAPKAPYCYYSYDRPRNQHRHLEHLPLETVCDVPSATHVHPPTNTHTYLSNICSPTSSCVACHVVFAHLYSGQLPRHQYRPLHRPGVVHPARGDPNHARGLELDLYDNQFHFFFFV